MYKLLIVTCVLALFHASLSQQIFDESTYNPCQSQEGLYFYPHPVDIHKYYQCDDHGNAFLRSCGDLVWDALRLACNWASAVVFPSTTTITITMSPTFTTTTTTTTRTTTIWSIPSEASTTTTTTLTTTAWTISPETLPIVLPPVTSPQPSLCNPVNPCGEHGVCVESIGTIPKSTQRFACICSENWFGRLCERQISDLTTPSTFASDQNQTLSQQNETFHFPIRTGKDSRLVFYGLHKSKPFPSYNETFDSSNETTTNSESILHDLEVSTSISDEPTHDYETVADDLQTSTSDLPSQTFSFSNGTYYFHNKTVNNPQLVFDHVENSTSISSFNETSDFSSQTFSFSNGTHQFYNETVNNPQTESDHVEISTQISSFDETSPLPEEPAADSETIINDSETSTTILLSDETSEIPSSTEENIEISTPILSLNETVTNDSETSTTILLSDETSQLPEEPIIDSETVINDLETSTSTLLPDETSQLPEEPIIDSETVINDLETSTSTLLSDETSEIPSSTEENIEISTPIVSLNGTDKDSQSASFSARGFKSNSTSNETFHFPIQTGKDAQLVFYGLSGPKLGSGPNKTLNN